MTVMSALDPSLRILGWTCCHVTPLYQVYITNVDDLQGGSGLVTGLPCGEA